MEENKTLLEKIKDLSVFDSFKIVWFIMIFVVIYYTLIAAPRYVSTMILDVRSTSGESAQTSGICLCLVALLQQAKI